MLSVRRGKTRAKVLNDMKAISRFYLSIGVSRGVSILLRRKKVLFLMSRRKKVLLQGYMYVSFGIL